MRGLILFLGSALLIVLGGCGSAAADKTYPVSGTVTYKGKSVPRGTIHFDPNPQTNPKGKSTSLSIDNGQFASDEKSGISQGDYIVRLQCFDGKAANEAPFGQALCEEQTDKHTQPAGPATLKFELPKAGGEAKPAGP